MIGFSLKPSFPLLLLLSMLFLHQHRHHCHILAAPSSQDDLAATGSVHDLAAEEKSPLWSWIKTGSVLSSVNRKGGSRSGSRGGSRGGSGGGGWKSGKGGGGGRVPIYAAGGAAAAAGAATGYAASGPHNHNHNGAAWNSGKPSRTLALAVQLAIALFFKHFA